MGSTNYWLYQNTVERLENSLDSVANSKLEGIASLSSYYLSHYEFELMEKLVTGTAAREGVLFVSIENVNGDVNFKAGLTEEDNTRHYQKKIIYDDQLVGTARLVMDASELQKKLDQALLNTILLVLFSVLILGLLIFHFFRNIIVREMELAHAEKEFFSVVMNSASSLVIVLSDQYKIIQANKTCFDYLPDSRSYLEGQYLWDAFPLTARNTKSSHAHGEPEIIKSADSLPCIKNNNCMSVTERDDIKSIIEWSFTVLEEDKHHSAKLIATGIDITKKHQESEALAYQALHDPLTNLPNRNLFVERLETAINLYKRKKEGFCLLYLDLDKFKPINDSLGHDAGDFVLKAIADMLLHNLRATDTVARLGGDEFGIIITDISSRETAEITAQKCIDLISSPIKYLSHKLELGVSIGLAYYPEFECDITQLVNYADTAMYEVKQNGRNGYCFYEHKMDN